MCITDQKGLLAQNSFKACRLGGVFTVLFFFTVTGCGYTESNPYGEFVDDGPCLTHEGDEAHGEHNGDPIPDGQGLEGLVDALHSRDEAGLVLVGPTGIADVSQLDNAGDNDPLTQRHGGDEFTPTPGDTDGDGYLDEHEIAEGTDPQDPHSRIYIGRWPYQPEKSGFEAMIAENQPNTLGLIGNQMQRFRLRDQFGQWVDLYDFAGHGKPIVIALMSQSCIPCQAIGAYFSDGDMSHFRIRSGPREGEFNHWWRPEYEDLYDLVMAGDVLWINVLSDHYYDAEASSRYTVATAMAWAQRYPNHQIPVLVDTDNRFRAAYGSRQVARSIKCLDENMIFLGANDSSSLRALFHEAGPLSD